MVDKIEVYNTRGIKGDTGETGAPGADGASAYQIWLDSGNTGTKQDFLDSLANPNSDFTEQRILTRAQYDAYTTDANGLYIVKETDGTVKQYLGDVLISGGTAITLAALTLSGTSISENASAGTVIGAINDGTENSTITLQDDAGGRFAISGTNLVTGLTGLDYETATSHDITLRETLAGATNSPNDTTITINIVDGDDLPTVLSSIPDQEANSGAAFTLDVSGNFSGANLVYSLTTNASWLSIDSNTGVITGTAPSAAETENVTVTATNAAGFVSDTFLLEVLSIPLRVVTSENRLLQARDGSGTRNSYATRRGHYMATDSNDLVFSFSSWRYSSSGQSNTAFDFDIVKASVERASDGETHPIYFNGQRSVTVTGGVTDLQSDPLLANTFSGQTVFSKDDLYYLRMEIHMPSYGDKLPYASNRVTQISGGEAFFFDRSQTSIENIDSGGDLTITGTDTRYARIVGFNCVAVLGHPVQDVVSIGALGDSITDLVDDGANVNDDLGAGYFQRAMHDAEAMTGKIPNFNFGRNGNSTGSFNGPSDTGWREYIKYARYFLEALGTNDLGTTSSDGKAEQLLLDCQGLWDIAKAEGAEAVLRMQLWPRTNSTDNWATTENQTYFTGWGVGEESDTVDGLFEAEDTSGNIIYVKTPSVRDTAEPLKWAVNGTARYTADDGTHPSSNGHELTAVDLRAVVATLT